MRAVSAGVMIAGHSAVRDDLAAVLALAADPGRHQHPPQRLRLPLRARHRRDAALVQVGADRPQGLAGQQAPGALAHDHRFRLAHRPPVGLVPVRPRPSARDLARLRQLLVLAPDPPALVVALLPRHGSEDTSEELAVMGGEVDVARTVASRVTPASLQTSRNSSSSLRLPMQPIRVPHHDRVELAAATSSSIRRVLRPHACRLYALTSSST